LGGGTNVLKFLHKKEKRKMQNYNEEIANTRAKIEAEERKRMILHCMKNACVKLRHLRVKNPN
jgi:hypothetical protein